MELFIELVDHGELSPIIWKMKAGDKLTLRPRAKGIFQIKDINYVDKLKNKIYYHHTGYPGGIRARTASDILSSATPEEIVSKAISRMIPKGPLGRKQIRNLKIYVGPNHPHEAQQPKVLDISMMNEKNKRVSNRG